MVAPSRETVIDGETGVFFHEQTPEALNEAIDRFETIDFDPARARRNAERFDFAVFEKQIRAFVEDRHEQYEGDFYGSRRR